MILRSNHRNHGFTIYKGEEARFFTFHEFLNNNGATSFAKSVATKHIINGCIGFVNGHGHNNTLAGR